MSKLGFLRFSKTKKIYDHSDEQNDALVTKKLFRNVLNVIYRKLNLKGWLGWLRIQIFITKLFGPQYVRNRHRVDIDITYECNLKCYNCNRSCGQAPTKERMTVNQIKKFVSDSIALKHKWELIKILGGEPTIHPDFIEIMGILKGWRDDYYPDAVIEVHTNGCGSKVKKVISQIPNDIIIVDTHKDSNDQYFDAFNIAPKDLLTYRFADYRNGCWITHKCGLGLTPYGWYQCAPAGGIDRIFGFGLGRDSIPDEDDFMNEQFETLCCLCGHFERRKGKKVKRTVISKSWDKAYKKYNTGK